MRYSRRRPSFSAKASTKLPVCKALGFEAGGVSWEIHKHDDDNISTLCPHLHSKEKPWKLNIYTREIFDINTRKYIGKKISFKEWMRLWSQTWFLNYVARERYHYENNFNRLSPKRYPALPAIPDFVTHLPSITTINARSSKNRIYEKLFSRVDMGLKRNSRIKSIRRNGVSSIRHQKLRF